MSCLPSPQQAAQQLPLLTRRHLAKAYYASGLITPKHPNVALSPFLSRVMAASGDTDWLGQWADSHMHVFACGCVSTACFTENTWILRCRRHRSSCGLWPQQCARGPECSMAWGLSSPAGVGPFHLPNRILSPWDHQKCFFLPIRECQNACQY